MKQEVKQAFKEAFQHTIPVLAGFLVIGMTYGLLMQTKGYSVVWSVAMSAIAFCGSMQFVAITLLTTVFNPLHAFLLSIMVNARHIFYGIAMLEKYKGMGKIKPFLIYTLCDETFCINCSTPISEKTNKKYFYAIVSFLDYLYWIIGTFIGGFFGQFIPINTSGIDFALTALFVVLFLNQWKEKENRFSCLVGIFSTAMGLFLFGKENLLIPSMLFVMAVLLIRRCQIKEGEEQ